MSFPDNKDSFIRVTDNFSDIVAKGVNRVQDTCENVQIKSGIDGSTVGTTLDYYLDTKEDPGHSHTSDMKLPLYLSTHAGIITNITVGENVSVGDALYIKSNGDVAKVNCASMKTSHCFFLSCTDTTSGNNATLLQYGLLKSTNFSTLLTGSSLYITTVAGGMVGHPPTATGNIVKRIGVVASHNIVYFKPSGIEMELV